MIILSYLDFINQARISKRTKQRRNEGTKTRVRTRGRLTLLIQIIMLTVPSFFYLVLLFPLK